MVMMFWWWLLVLWDDRLKKGYWKKWIGFDGSSDVVFVIIVLQVFYWWRKKWLLRIDGGSGVFYLCVFWLFVRWNWLDFSEFSASRVLNLVVFFIMTGLGFFKEPNSLGLWRRQMYLLLNFRIETRLTDCVLGLGWKFLDLDYLDMDKIKLKKKINTKTNKKGQGILIKKENKKFYKQN